MGHSFSSEKRQDYILNMKRENLDLLVIGGGITGAGIALDATVRGLKVGLVEMQDFSAGTSSRSTKLIHGGLRYLKQFEMKLVSEVGKERAIVHENAPHVTTPEKMLLPIYKDGTFGKLSTSVGLKLYDKLADVKKSERRTMLTKRQTLKEEPLIRTESLKGGGLYVEYRTDDARLTIETLKEAVRRGAIAVNYLKVESLVYEDGKAIGALVVDQLTSEAHKIFAKKIVNATGPWVDGLREQDRSNKGNHVALSKGVHIVVDHALLPLKQAVYFDTKKDERMMFAIPRDGKTYIGTTDTFYEGELMKPRMTSADLDYILEATNDMFPTIQLHRGHVESSWAGLRPLIYENKKTASEISRKDEVFRSESGLLSIAGGKLTGYRKMAERVVDIVTKELAIVKECETDQITLSGGYVGGPKGFDDFVQRKVEEGAALGLDEKEAEELVRRYGSNITNVFSKLDTFRKKASSFGLPASIYAQVRYGIEEEMVETPLDFFMRRTAALYFNIGWVEKWKEPVIHCMCDALKWTEDLKERHVKELDEELYFAKNPV